jgi:hypothetical protein
MLGSSPNSASFSLLNFLPQLGHRQQSIFTFIEKAKRVLVAVTLTANFLKN